MKHLIIILLFSTQVQGQTLEAKLIQYAKVTPIFMGAGYAAAYHHNSSPLNGHKMMTKHPNWNPRFNDGRISHYRKWELVRSFTLQELYTLSDSEIIARDTNGDRIERYAGSSTVFVPFSDLWHLSQSLQRTLEAGGFIYLGHMSRGQNWKWYVVDLIYTFGVRSLTFQLTDNTFNDG